MMSGSPIGDMKYNLPKPRNLGRDGKQLPPLPLTVINCRRRRISKVSSQVSPSVKMSGRGGWGC